MELNKRETLSEQERQKLVEDKEKVHFTPINFEMLFLVSFRVNVGSSTHIVVYSFRMMSEADNSI